MREIRDISYRARRGNEASRALYWLRRSRVHCRTLCDIAGGLRRDAMWRAGMMRLPPPQLVRHAPLFAGETGPRRLCLYAAWSPRSVVSDMVFAQLRAYRDAGFAVVFVSMSDLIAEADAARLRECCPVVIRRASRGRDFGAWAEALGLLGPETDGLDALLLTNDSVLGPIRPLAPFIAPCLAAPGLFGLTESLGGGSHLQSYFLLANGQGAVADAARFLRDLRLSFSKWIMVQRGELGLSRAMREKGHTVAAVLDHVTLEDTLVSEPELQTELSVMHPGLFRGIAPLPPARAGDPALAERNRYLLRRRLFGRPLNPGQHLATVLVRRFGFPFIKAEFVAANPALAPSAAEWRSLVTADSPVTVAMLEAHLAALD